MIDKAVDNTLHYPTVLVIAGSDSIGGAGIQADIKTCTALGVYAMTAITAVTAQNTCGVRAYEAVTPALIDGQLRAILDDVRPDAVKIGMLPNADAVRIVAETLRSHNLSNVVLDPVCVATSGDRLNDGDSVSALLKTLLMPLADIVTPNIPELELLTGMIVTADTMLTAARALQRQTGCRDVLAKGGHLTGNKAVDIFVTATGDTRTFSHDFVDTVNTHGTGCTLSSAIAATLACGAGPGEAVKAGIEYVSAAICAGAAYKFGHGHGPVNHMHKIMR